MESNYDPQSQAEHQTAECNTLIGDDEIESEFELKCLSCSTETDLVTCIPCRHQCICLDCLDTYFNHSDECPFCKRTADGLLMPGGHVAKEIALPISEEDENVQCCVCLETCAPTILFPCLHNTFCFTCVYNFQPKKCPLCRQDVRSIKESKMLIRSMRSIEQEISCCEITDLETTMQVVLFAQNGPRDLLQLQEVGVQQSRFSPNWKIEEKCMRLTWYSSFTHISLQILLDKKPDVIVIVQHGSSSEDLIAANHAHHNIRNLIHEYFEPYLHPRISRLVINETTLHFTGDYTCNIYPESSTDEVVHFDFGTSIALQKQNCQYRETFHQTLWDSAQLSRLMVNF